MNNPVTIHTNTDVEDFTRTISKIAEHRGVTHVLGVARGGLVLATYLAYYLDVPMMITNYSSPKGNAEHPSENYLPQTLVDVDNPADKDSVILIVDDIADTGHTLNYLKLVFARLGNIPEGNIITTSMNWRVGAIKPDLYGWEIAPEEDIEYPWNLDVGEEE